MTTPDSTPAPPGLTPRRFLVEFPDDVPKHWFGGSAFLSHMLNVYTLLVPENERYYIRRLKRAMPQIEDAALKRELLKFFRQEGLHGLAHERYWKNLEAQGLRYRGFLRLVNGFLYRVIEPALPQKLHLAIVAAIEHINAYLGHIFLARGLLRDADERLRLLFEWHFAEEIEHKAIAYDAFRAAGGNYPVRLLSALLAFPLFYAINTIGTFYLVAQDGALFSPRTWRDGFDFLFRKGVARDTLGFIAAYLRPDFHPWHTADYELARRFFSQPLSERIEPDPSAL
jgi:predicted metal-dependent hydrolase